MVLFGQGEVLDLAKAIKIGLRNNFQVQIANTETSLAKYRYEQAYRDRLPIVAINLSQNNNFNKINNPTSFVEGFYRDQGLNATLDANWVIFHGFKHKANKEQLKAMENLSVANADLLLENAIQAIQLAYYNAIVERENLNAIREVLQLSKAKLTDAQLQEELGKVSRYDVLRFENAYLADTSQLIQQVMTYELAIQKLNLAIGNKKLIDYELIEPIRYLNQAFDCDDLLPNLLQDNQQLRNQMLNVVLKKSSTFVQKANRYPTLRFNAGANQRWSKIKFEDLPKASGEDLSFYLNFTLSYTLFDAGVTERAVQESKIATSIERYELEEIKQQLKSELCQYVTAYNSQLQIVNINETLIENLRLNLEMLDDQIKSGLASSLEYRIVQVEYLNAKKTRLESIKQLKSTEVMIAKLTGGLKTK